MLSPIRKGIKNGSFKKEWVHIYTDVATNSLKVKRLGKNVTASFHARNEIPNVNQTDGLLDKARNAIVAVSAMAGVSKIQWKDFVENLLASDRK